MAVRIGRQSESSGECSAFQCGRAGYSAHLGRTGAGGLWATGRPAARCHVDRRRVAMQAPRIAQQWERAVVLRLGRFVGLRGPDCSGSCRLSTVSSWIDQRTITTSFAAEQTLTSIRFRSMSMRCSSGWSTTREGGPRSAGLRPSRPGRHKPHCASSGEPRSAIRCADGNRSSRVRCGAIDQRSNPWGVTVSSVEMRDVVIP
jgi:hypothetical protein